MTCSRLVEKDREGIGLLAGRATSHPDSHRHVSRAALEQLGENVLFEHRKGFLVSEEARHTNQEIAVEQVQLAALTFESLDVFVDVAGECELDAALDASRYG